MYRKLIYFLLNKFPKVSSKDKLVILTYHRILEKDNEQEGMVVLKKSFEKQMEFISKNYNVISFEDLINKNLKKNSLIITFDDGYKDLKDAKKILDKYNLKATVFLTTDFIDGKKPWWDKEGVFLSWDEIKNLNFEVGAHSVSHPILSKLDREELKKEIVDCKEILEKNLSKIKIFSYPHGKKDDFNLEAEKLVEENYSFGVSNIFGINNLKNLKKTKLHRINVFWNDMNIFKAKIRGFGR